MDQDYTGWRGYIMASLDLAPAYVGALAFYSSGTDITSLNTYSGGAKIGTDFQPCLILWNYDLGRWNGVLGGQNGVTMLPRMVARDLVTWVATIRTML